MPEIKHTMGTGTHEPRPENDIGLAGEDGINQEANISGSYSRSASWTTTNGAVTWAKPGSQRRAFALVNLVTKKFYTPVCLGQRLQDRPVPSFEPSSTTISSRHQRLGQHRFDNVGDGRSFIIHRNQRRPDTAKPWVVWKNQSCWQSLRFKRCGRFLWNSLKVNANQTVVPPGSGTFDTRTKNSLAGGRIVALASSQAAKSGVPPRVFGSRTGPVLELAAGTAALRCGCQMAPPAGLFGAGKRGVDRKSFSEMIQTLRKTGKTPLVLPAYSCLQII